MGSGRQTEEGYTSGQLCVVMEVSAQQEELLVHQFPGMESSSSSQHNHSHLQSHTHYQYAHVFPFEDRFDQRVAQGWVQEHWVSVYMDRIHLCPLSVLRPGVDVLQTCVPTP